LHQVQCNPSADINLILGANGAGKTSVLEAIFCLSRGRSFRANSLQALIQDSQQSFIVRAGLQSDIPHQLALQIQKSSSETPFLAKIDGEKVKTLVELSYLLPTVILDPAIHKLIEDGPKERRRFIDWGVFHVEPQFMQHWRRYRRALKQRNAGLKTQLSDSELQVWTDMLLESGLFIDRARKQYLQALGPVITALASDLLQTEVKLSYRSGWVKDLDYAQALEKSHERERNQQTTVVGPHRADLMIQVGSEIITTADSGETDSSSTKFHKARQRVSRGQQKLIAASLILAQAKHFRATQEFPPILLIDDPFAELDNTHCMRLLQEIQNIQAQSFITALNPLDHPIFHQAQRFMVEDGGLRSLD